MKILHLTLLKKWFDDIYAGVKKEEYRTIKPYWERRLIGKTYTHILFRNGYQKNARQFLIELKSVRQGPGRVEWGAPANENLFVLSLGEIVKAQQPHSRNDSK
ncbi:hypothetical protein [Alteromonas macleodii]|uniref:hypothetical protein n=1 Tax=Alteromonas macleodii TaxID=28108 RepID=UPI00196B6BF8|nr:hypothetical protein [Alteromonas macleodii]